MSVFCRVSTWITNLVFAPGVLFFFYSHNTLQLKNIINLLVKLKLLTEVHITKAGVIFFFHGFSNFLKSNLQYKKLLKKHINKIKSTPYIIIIIIITREVAIAKEAFSQNLRYPKKNQTHASIIRENILISQKHYLST